MTISVSDQRLDRIENKLDQVAEALTLMARVEERQAAHNSRMDRFELRLDMNEADLDGVKREVTDNVASVRLGERLSWAGLAAVLSGLASWATKNF